jgi:hypothetical protein
MIAPLFTDFKQSKENRQWIDQRSAERTSEPDSIQRMNFRISSGRVGGQVNLLQYISSNYTASNIILWLG